MSHLKSKIYSTSFPQRCRVHLTVTTPSVPLPVPAHAQTPARGPVRETAWSRVSVITVMCSAVPTACLSAAVGALRTGISMRCVKFQIRLLQLLSNCVTRLLL